MNWEKGRQLAFLLKDGLSVQFKYNNSGIRTKKIVNGDETEYFYVGDTLVSQKTGDEVINFAYTAGGAPLGFTYNGTPYYYMPNLQGDIEKIYDSNGYVVVTYFYDAWGKLISIEDYSTDNIGIKNPLRYRGYYYDTETGFYYLQSRYYDPEICRFINADSLLIAGNDYIQGANMYAYCYNNPVMYSDPNGMEAYYKDTSNPAVFCACLISAWAIMLGGLGMSPYEVAMFTLEVGDVGDLVYIAEIMYNGKVKGDYKENKNEHIKGSSFDECRSFLKKSVCLKVARYYTWAYKGDGDASMGIAQEIYAHAVVYYYSQNVIGLINIVKETNPYVYYTTPEYQLVEVFMDSFLGKRTERIDLGEEGLRATILLPAYNFIWDNF